MPHQNQFNFPIQILNDHVLDDTSQNVARLQLTPLSNSSGLPVHHDRLDHGHLLSKEGIPEDLHRLLEPLLVLSHCLGDGGVVVEAGVPQRVHDGHGATKFGTLVIYEV